MDFVADLTVVLDAVGLVRNHNLHLTLFRKFEIPSVAQASGALCRKKICFGACIVFVALFFTFYVSFMFLFSRMVLNPLQSGKGFEVSENI